MKEGSFTGNWPAWLEGLVIGSWQLPTLQGATAVYFREHGGTWALPAHLNTLERWKREYRPQRYRSTSTNEIFCSAAGRGNAVEARQGMVGMHGRRSRRSPGLCLKSNAGAAAESCCQVETAMAGCTQWGMHPLGRSTMQQRQGLPAARAYAPPQGGAGRFAHRAAQTPGAGP